VKSKKTETTNERPAGVSREKAARLIADPPLHLRTIDRMIRSGKLTAFRAGTRVLITVASIDELVKSGFAA
jgi:excisionase family DNA binding protein